MSLVLDRLAHMREHRDPLGLPGYPLSLLIVQLVLLTVNVVAMLLRCQEVAVARKSVCLVLPPPPCLFQCPRHFLSQILLGF